jgi:type 1 glutamine amidotransferase
MSHRSRIVFHVGGPEFHPVAQQAAMIAHWLGNEFDCEQHDGVDAFDALPGCDLLVLMGLHWSGMKAARMTYRAMAHQHQCALENYIASGKPLLCHHGAVASYDDWPRFGELCGVAWIWGKTSHSPIGNHTVRLCSGHPVVAGVSDFAIYDELYYALKIADDVEPDVHATAEFAGTQHPMIMTGSGGRIAGAGKWAYLANGHDLRAFECPAMKQLWINAVAWLLEK